jgi:lipopolysaccharide export system protein LptA
MSKPYFRNSLLMLVAFFLTAAASQGAGPKKATQEPIVITSNRMEAEQLGEKVTFTGNVLLKKEKMTMQSDSMIVYYDAGSKDINEIEAHGNVIVRKDGRIALANQAFYYSREEKIVLTGDARIVENDNELGGKKITLFMRNDHSIVEGGTVLFYQDKTDQKIGRPENGTKLK